MDATGPAGGNGSAASAPVVLVRDLTKVYRLYDSPTDRLKEVVHPLRKSYHRDFFALRDVSFEIRRGEAVGIVGRNGSGKSTLLKIVAGVLSPTRGTVAVDGRLSSILELGAGFNPEFTGVENVYFSGALAGYTRRDVDARLDDILAFADIGQYAHQPVKMYSSGMYVRLAFAVAISVEPEILILDEVLAVGDIAFQNKCLRAITALAESGKTTLLFVTHDMNALRLLCDRALLLEDGALRSDGPPPRIIDRYARSVFDAPSSPGSKVLSVAVVDDSNVRVEEVPCRGPCSLVMEVNDLSVEKGLLVAMRFVNVENRFSLRLETDAFRALTGKLARRRLVAGFRELNLPPGYYTVNVSVSDGSYLNRLHHVDDAVRFRVKEDPAATKFIEPLWREGDPGVRKIGIVGWWGGGNEGDRYLLEVLARALGAGCEIRPIGTPFDIGQAAVDALNGLDYLIVGGGGLFTTELPRPFDTFPKWKGALRTPFSLVGVGIQGVRPEDEDAFRQIVAAARGIVVRDRESLDLVGRFSTRTDIRRAPDLSFLYPRAAATREDASAVGVNLRVWDFDAARTYDNRAWCDAINALPGEKTTVPLSTAESLDDRDAMRNIAGRRNAAFDMSLYADVGVMIGMRLHSLIFAAQCGIPVIGIAYVPKVRRFLRDAGMEEFCLGVNEHGRLRDVFRRALERRRVLSEALKEYTESSRREILRHIETLKRDLAGATGEGKEPARD